MKIETIKEYLTLAKMKSFTAAAERLYLTQPALSKHIAAMEMEIGAKLVKRTTHSVQLTEAGNAAVLYFENIIGNYDKACESIRALDEGYSRLLRLGFLLHSLDSNLYSATKIIQGIDPLVNVEIHYMNAKALAEGLIDSKLDANLQPSISFAPGKLISSVPALTSRLFVLVLESDCLFGREKLRFSDLRDRRVVVTEGEHGSVEFIERLFLQSVGSVPEIVETPQKETQLFTMRECRGIAIVACESVGRLPLGVRPIPVEDDCAVQSFHWFFRASDDSEGLRCFLNKATCAIRESQQTSEGKYYSY